MLVKTTDKFTAIHAFINEWLKDKTLYCASCGTPYIEGFECCEEPEITDNYTHAKMVIDGIKEQKKCYTNVFASNKGKNFRPTVRLPKRLYHDIEKYLSTYGEKFLSNERDMLRFAKKFPMFCLPEKL